MKARQTRFSAQAFRTEDKFGGSLSTKRRFRTARPVSTKESMHLILKSSVAKGRFSLRAGDNFQKIDAIVKRNCAKFGVKLLKYSNNFNHLHFHVKLSSRVLYKRFVRSVSAHIAMSVSGACKSKSMYQAVGQKTFWDRRPFSRIVRGWRGFKIVSDYVKLNQLEAEQIIPKRDTRLRGVTPEQRKLFNERASDAKRKRSDSQLGLFEFE
jgi:putative transposase